MVTASLAGLLIGIALTLSIVLGTHTFERVRNVPVLTDAGGSQQSSAALTEADKQRVDDENMIRHDPVGQSPASVAADQLRVDQENMIRHDPVGQSPASLEADQLPVDAANKIRHDPPLPSSNP
jgi:hypothetical protein